jgi:hypothetical protein
VSHLPKGQQEVCAQEVFAIDVALQALGRRTGVQIPCILLPALLH